jgi:hypothetical protein
MKYFWYKTLPFAPRSFFSGRTRVCILSPVFRCFCRRVFFTLYVREIWIVQTIVSLFVRQGRIECGGTASTRYRFDSRNFSSEIFGLATGLAHFDYNQKMQAPLSVVRFAPHATEQFIALATLIKSPIKWGFYKCPQDNSTKWTVPKKYKVHTSGLYRFLSRNILFLYNHIYMSKFNWSSLRYIIIFCLPFWSKIELCQSCFVFYY